MEYHTVQETRRASISESVAADKLAPPGSAQSEDKYQVQVQVYMQVQV